MLGLVLQLGGNSLQAAAVVSEVRISLHQTVSVGWLLETETIRGFTARLFGGSDKEAEDASEQLLAAAASASQAGTASFPLSYQQV